MIRIEAAGAPVLIGEGLIDRAGAALSELLPPTRFFLVADSNLVRCGWADRLSEALGGLLGRCAVPPGEASKTLAQAEALLDALIEAGVERSDHVVALGGGVVGDLAGLAAALLKRGCGLVQVPTSLVAQADSAIGGKTGVNARQGKNLIGAFHPPSAVLIDPAALATLPERELRAGYAEVAKYGLIGDPDFFAWCEANAPALLRREPAALACAIEACVRAKTSYVEGDERDSEGRRALLNFGHSFGHAIEAEAGLAHGEAVAIGMALAFRLSAALGHCAAAEAERVEAHLAAAGLPTRLGPIDPARLLRRMAHDKKSSGGRLRLVLVRSIGGAFLAPLEEEDLAAFLAAEAAQPGSRSASGWPGRNMRSLSA